MIKEWHEGYQWFPQLFFFHETSPNQTQHIPTTKSPEKPDPERTVLGAAEWCRTLHLALDATSRAQGYDVITCGTVLRAIGQEIWKWFMEAASFAF